VILGLTGLEKLGPRMIETVVWICVACAIPLADLVLQWEESARSRPTIPVRAAEAKDKTEVAQP